MKRGEKIPLRTVMFVQRRDHNRCRFCLNRVPIGRFPIHHKKYRSRGGSNDPINLVLLCLEDHTATHAGKKSHAIYRTASYQNEGESEESLQ